MDCGGKQELHAGGSTAQANAIEQFAYAYSRACPGQALVYNATGSATGVDDFIANEIDLVGSELAMDPAKTQPERAAERCGSLLPGTCRWCSVHSPSPITSTG